LSRPHCVCVIFARGGSKGLPRKNLVPLAGRPLIAWSISMAQLCPSIDRVVVSTEDDEIARVAEAWGAEVPFRRPPELAADNSPEWLAWRHAVQTLDGAPGARPIDLFVTLPPTSPLRAVEDVEATIAKVRDEAFDMAITVRNAARSPYYNMVKLAEDSAASLVIAPDKALHRRQDAPRVYDITTVAYATRPAYMMAHLGLFEGRVGAVVVPEERALDIDTPLDLRVGEALSGDSPLFTDSPLFRSMPA
jgi:N,N'-diacetyl-8-epilegionaminate cytidylyltransferase